MVVVCVKGGGRGEVLARPGVRGRGGRTQRDSVSGNERRGKSKTHGPAVCERRVFFLFLFKKKIHHREVVTGMWHDSHGEE